MKFEYKVLLVDPGWSARDGRESIENQLNELGKDGWELLSIAMGGYLFLERAKPDAKD
jgi:hypothetical protein